MAQAGVESAVLNVKINLGSIKNETFVKNISSELDLLNKNTRKKTEEILSFVIVK
jgi:formiminotetrahydrofolate cyclodeaminase